MMNAAWLLERRVAGRESLLDADDLELRNERLKTATGKVARRTNLPL